MIKECYREDYVGEYVIKRITIRNGKKEQEKEWIDNPLTLSNTSKRATCIANNNRYNDAFYNRIQHNNGGNLNKMKMQTYGVDSVCDKMVPDFLVTKDIDLLESMIKTAYTEKTIVYTSATNCIKYPEQFYLVPYNLSLNAEALAIWLACFDGHQEIFIVGYDNLTDKIAGTVASVMKVYKSVKFVHVTNGGSPHEWKSRLNFEIMTKDQYVSYCDV